MRPVVFHRRSFTFWRSAAPWCGALLIAAVVKLILLRTPLPTEAAGIGSGLLPIGRRARSATAELKSARRVVDTLDDQALLASLRREIEAGADGLKLLRDVAMTRPALAIELALVLGRSGDEKDQWVTELTKAWTACDAQGAWEWLGRQASRMDQLANGSLIGVVLSGMAAHAPERVVENVDALLRRGDVPGIIPPLVACQLGLQALIEHGAVDVARAAVDDWARHPRGLDVGASAYNVVAGAIAETSWAEASAWLESLPLSRDRNSAFAVLASKWSDHDPAAALDWAEGLAPNDDRFAGIQSAFSEWVEHDAAGASDWLADYVDRAPTDQETDRLIGSLVTFSSTLNRNPELALEWLQSMRDQTQRSELTERVVLRWGRRDATAAAAYVDASADLSMPQKLTLRQKLTDQQEDPIPTDE